MPFLAFLANPKLIIGALLVIAAITYHIYAVSSAREDGRNEVRAEVRKVTEAAERAVQDETVRQLGKLYRETQNRNRVLREGLDAIEREGADCLISDSLRRHIERLRNPGQPGEGENR